MSIKLGSFFDLISLLPWLFTIGYSFLLLLIHRLVSGSQPFHLPVYLEGDEEESRRRGRATFAEVLPPSSLRNYR